MQDNFKPLVSIVIPVYNGSNYMREAIDSALAQTYTNIEVIVVNDGSTDNTDEIARSYGDKIRYFSKENGGVSTALNLAIENMKGEYFSWLSHDDMYLPEKIESQINILRNLDDKTTIVNSRNDAIDAEGNKKQSWKYEIPDKYVDKPLYYVFTTKLTGCSLLIHKSHFMRCGEFDCTQKITQDYDMWFKILRKAKIYDINKVLVLVREHSGSVTNTSDKYYSESDEFWCGLLDQITDKEINDNFINKLNFYTEVAMHYINSFQPKKTKKAYIAYYNELKNNKRTLKNIIDQYKIEKRYAYAFKNFNVKDFFTFIIYLRHKIKWFILHKD